ncbi:hypothetical protein Fsol_00394 [Candidatus Fokinia solitaria]|uniref:Uncharacterized protein n=1 Tax=Candidatus Fokinia solitaria TaxID=1802984 RepID=A0A2U8BS74_9RICK|nr:hypothetical protein Fsol_00394 [Candidatus Fokinia solitaria]
MEDVNFSLIYLRVDWILIAEAVIDEIVPREISIY